VHRRIIAFIVVTWLPLVLLTLAGGTAFGVITNTRLPTGDSGSARQIQFAAKLLF